MTKAWAMGLLKHGYYTSKISVPFAPLTEHRAHENVQFFLELFSEDSILPLDVAQVVRKLVQNRMEPISRFQWVSEYANIMHKRINGASNIDYCTESAQNAVHVLAFGEWMYVSPADAVQGEMECWND